MKKVLFALTVFAVLGLLLSGCRSEAAEEDTTLRVALLPIMQTLPFYIAEQNGYFSEQDIQVELVPVNVHRPDPDLVRLPEPDNVPASVTWPLAEPPRVVFAANFTSLDTTMPLVLFWFH